MPLPSVRTAAAGVAVAGLVTAVGLRSSLDAQQSAPVAKPTPVVSGKPAPAAAGKPTPAPAKQVGPASATVPAASTAATDPPHVNLVYDWCLECHDDNAHEAGLSLQAIVDDKNVGAHADIWEVVVKKLRTRQMPPVGEARPDENYYTAALGSLEGALDRAAAVKPNPGRTAAIRRLTRTEYQNAVRDLIALDVDVDTLLPADESSYGFDNVTVGDLPPTLLERYISAAEKISRLAVGGASRSPGGDTIRMPPDLTQEEHIEGLPIGTRGGVAMPYTFPQTGEYEIQVRLRRDRDEKVEGLNNEEHELEILLDRARVQVLGVKPVQIAGPNEKPMEPDAHLNVRVPVTAGPHVLGVTFIKKPSSLVETPRQPYQAHFNSYRHPRLQPAIYSVSILGPFDAKGPGDTPSRRRLFVSRPANVADEDRAARQIIRTLARRAYRRPVTETDLQGPLALYKKGRADADFEAGIEMALAGVLVSPQFLFRVETDPAGLPANTPYRISDLALASRLSFFLWSSLPDEELLTAATTGTLHQPAVLEKQVRRMLADGRSRALITNFASQWLHLRNLDSITPDMRLYPDFDDNLRRAFRRETELFVDSILREDRSAVDLLNTDYTFLNERLAKHYGIPNVYGDRFRRVTLPDDSWRGGLLRQGSILTVTSYATRTSPVIRGKWVLDNLMGVPPPPPLPNVPALKDNTVDGSLSGRKRLAEHRSNATCARCHNVIDPVGLTLENFDAVGRRRSAEDGEPIDASGWLPDGSFFKDVDGLEAALVKRPEIFVSTLTEKLMTYALGRGVEYYDQPAIRTIVRDARPQNYRMSSVILGIVNSKPFQMRTSR